MTECSVVQILNNRSEDKPREGIVLVTKMLSVDSLVLVAARLPSQGFNPFLGNNRHHNKGSHRISPPPAEERIEEEPGQQNRREISTQLRLLGIGLHGPAVQLHGDVSFRPYQKRHDDQRDRCQDNSDQTGIKGVPSAITPLRNHRARTPRAPGNRLPRFGESAPPRVPCGTHPRRHGAARARPRLT